MRFSSQPERDMNLENGETSEADYRIFDTHAHVTSSAFDHDREDVLERAQAARVVFMEIGFDEESSSKAAAFAENIGTYCAVGIHPHDAVRDDCEHSLIQRWKRIQELARSSDRVKAIGEIGLDYFRDLSPRDAQAECFRIGLDLARKLKLPVVIHQRDAHQDVLSIVQSENMDVPLIFHCFSQDISYARKCLDLGGYIGIGGPVTYPRNNYLRDLLQYIPSDRLLVETDCPYLPPQGKRGKRNEPSFIVEVVNTISTVLNRDFAEISNITFRNGIQAFGIEAEMW